MAYSLAAYGDMIDDRGRMQAYAAALRRAIHPGATVVDIGTGTGIMACLACAYGAARVYALEPADVIGVARAVARANKLDDRIDFIQTPSTAVTLPQPADVIVSDLRGVLPLFQSHVPSIIDARRRLLKPGGTLIARRDVIWMALASAPDLHAQHLAPWERNDYGLDMRAVSEHETNAWRQCHARPEHLASAPQHVATLDYMTVDSPDITGEVRFEVGRGTMAHGLLVWFDAEVDGDACFSNAPGAPSLIYGQAFFPWPRALDLDVGDAVTVRLGASLVRDDYVWTWTTCLAGNAGERKVNFRQSTFLGIPRSRETLARRSARHVPFLNEDGRLDRLVLDLFAQRLPLGRIADEAMAKFPDRLRTREAALARVADLSIRYSEE